MKAVLCSAPDPDLATTALAEVPVPEPAGGELLVRVHAASLNPVDWKLAAGIAPWWHEPHIVGLDAAGVVAAVADGVAGFEVGDRVVWHGNLDRQGVFAEYATVEAHVVSRVPDAVSFRSAAALPCAGYTAFQGLMRKARLQADDVVVVQGASGGVGGFAVQLASAVGARVIALARPEQADRITRLGADHVLDYRATDLAEHVRALTPDGAGADIMLEVVRPDDARRSLDLLRYNGQLVCIDPLPDLSRVPPYTYAASIHEVALGGAYAANHLPTQRDFAAIGDELLGLLVAGRLDPMIEQVIGIDEIPTCLQRLRNREVDGKIVAQISSPEKRDA